MSSRTILVVDDSPTMRNLLAVSLRRIPGLDLVEAGDGAQALEVMRSRQVDLILLDVNMPTMGGFVFLEKMAQEFDESHRPSVVMVTTEGQQEEIDRAFQLGASAYVTKPVQSATLVNTIRSVLQG